jgi:hypothetical protein
MRFRRPVQARGQPCSALPREARCPIGTARQLREAFRTESVPGEAATAVERSPMPGLRRAGGQRVSHPGRQDGRQISHTARFILVPSLREELTVAVPAERSPGKPWAAGPPVAAGRTRSHRGPDPHRLRPRQLGHPGTAEPARRAHPRPLPPRVFEGRGRTYRRGLGSGAYGLASKMMLNGVSVARRTWLNPASRSRIASWRSPACAPSPRPTSWASEPGVQMTVDSP